MKKITGIYKITSPSGRVYIGQSFDINFRLYRYRKLYCKRQPKLFSSLKKYGFENHNIQIIHELPNDIEEKTLNRYERLYIELHKSCGIDLLNLTDGGEGILNPSEETRKKLSLSGKGRIFSDETKLKMSKAKKGRKISEEQRRKQSELMTGKPSRSKGSKHSEETKRLMSITRKGRISGNKGNKYTEEQRLRMSNSMRGKPKSKEHVANVAKALKGKPKSELHKYKLRLANLGKKASDDTKKKLSDRKKGVKQSAEHIRKRVESLKKYHLLKNGI